MALTATANEQVMKDVIDRLKMKDCNVLTQSFNRPNLFYEIRPKPLKNAVFYTELAAAINRQYRHQTGIVYCSSKPKCEELAVVLSRAKIKADYFHADLPDSEKERVISGWQAGDIKVVVATVRAVGETTSRTTALTHVSKIAFGMGIDKADGWFLNSVIS